MSKKTNAEKLERRRVRNAKPRKHSKHPRRRLNPAKRDNRPVFVTNGAAGIFTDPVFMHHFCGAVFRALELTMPETFEASKVDAEFLPPAEIVKDDGPPLQ